MHPQVDRLNRCLQRIGQPGGARRGGGAGHVHQHLGHQIVLVGQVQPGQQIVAVVAFGQRRRGRIACCGIKGIDRGPHRLAVGNRVGMQADEHIGPGGARDRNAGFQRHEHVLVARHHHVKAAVAQQQLFQFARKAQHQGGLGLPVTLGSGVKPAMAGVQHHHQRPVAAPCGGGQQCGVGQRPFGRFGQRRERREFGLRGGVQPQRHHGAGVGGHLRRRHPHRACEFDHQPRPAGAEHPRAQGQQGGAGLRHSGKAGPVHLAQVQHQTRRAVHQAHPPRHRLRQGQRDDDAAPGIADAGLRRVKPGQRRQRLARRLRGACRRGRLGGRLVCGLGICGPGICRLGWRLDCRPGWRLVRRRFIRGLGGRLDCQRLGGCGERGEPQQHAQQHHNRAMASVAASSHA